MTESVVVIVVHQIMFQGMFFAKNIILSRRLGKPIRGANTEANTFIGFFVFFLGLTIYLASRNDVSVISYSLPDTAANILGIILMGASAVIAWASLKDLGDSWRVGVIEEQQTALIDTGIYRHTRNPYFLAYLILFVAYTVFLQSLVLLFFSALGFRLIHSLVRREEAYLTEAHGDAYQKYKQGVPRYLWC
jgi:protein-S-isoprenylcysteine O-methyltransferase Ste14